MPFFKVRPMDGIDTVTLAVRPEHLYIVAAPNARSILTKIEFIDDMGADKLIQVVSVYGNVRITVRITANLELNSTELLLAIDLNYAILFCSKTCKNLGGWSA